MNVCQIGIDATTKKLFMSMKMSQTDFFKEESLNISDISINPGVTPHRLVYYHILKRHLLDEILNKDGSGNSEVEGPIAGVVRFERNTEGIIDKLDGHWYDLEGVFASRNRELASLTSGAALANSPPTSGTISFELLDASKNRWRFGRNR